jgi:hypothetical protein
MIIKENDRFKVIGLHQGIKLNISQGVMLQQTVTKNTGDIFKALKIPQELYIENIPSFKT